MFSRWLLLGLLILPCACTQRLFEHDTRQSYALDAPARDPRLMDIQFFVSERIVLRREQTSRASTPKARSSPRHRATATAFPTT